MPELPEVETVCRGLSPHMEGRVIAHVRVARRDLRQPVNADFEAKVEGHRIARIMRRAKYIIMELEGGGAVLAHLGMSGTFRIVAQDAFDEAKTHDHLEFETDQGTRVIYNDPRRFGIVMYVEQDALDAHPLLAHIGPEPFSNMFNGPYMKERLRGRKTAIKVAILDQKLVAGVGNIYASEALFRAGVHPTKESGRVSGPAFERLAHEIKVVLKDAIAAGGSTLKDFHAPEGDLGYFPHAFKVYDREGEACVTKGCAGTVRRLVQTGRSTFYCPKCQR